MTNTPTTVCPACGGPVEIPKTAVASPPQQMKGAGAVYGPNGLPLGQLRIAQAVAAAAISLAMFALGRYFWVLWHLGGPLKPDSKQTAWFVGVWVVWVVGPPLWFCYEYFLLYKRYAPPDSFDAFKYGQEQSAKIWAAIVVVIGAFVVAGLK